MRQKSSRRRILNTLGTVGVSVIGFNSIHGSAAANDEIEPASSQELQVHNSDAIEVIEKWDGIHSNAAETGDAFSISWFGSEYYTDDRGWIHEVGVSGAGTGIPHDMLWGHEYQIGPPEQGTLYLDLSEGGVYPNNGEESDPILPSWTVPLMGPVVSAVAGSSAPGWMIAGGAALREVMAGSDNGYGVGPNQLSYQKSNNFFDFDSFEALSFCHRLKYETGVAIPVAPQADLAIEGKFKRDTPITEDDWQGVQAEVVIGDEVDMEDPIGGRPRSNTNHPTKMSRERQQKFGIKRVDASIAERLNVGTDGDIPRFIATKPMLSVRNAKKISKPSTERETRGENK